MTICTNDETVKGIARKCYPEYNGRKFEVTVSDRPINCASYWDGGSRTYFKFYSLADGRVSPQLPAQSAFDTPVNGIEAVQLPPGFACVKHSIFCGHDCGIEIVVRPENATKFLPVPVQIDEQEKIVLRYTCGLKSSYAGISNYRFHEAHRATGIHVDDWDAAKARLVKKGMLNRAGAITNDGRNAVSQFRGY